MILSIFAINIEFNFFFLSKLRKKIAGNVPGNWMEFINNFATFIQKRDETIIWWILAIHTCTGDVWWGWYSSLSIHCYMTNSFTRVIELDQTNLIFQWANDMFEKNCFAHWTESWIVTRLRLLFYSCKGIIWI